MDGPRPTRHRHGADLVWFPFEPTDFVERAGHHADDYPGLGDRLASCRQAAWKCDCYLAFAEVVAGGVAETAMLWVAGEDLAVDLDRGGNPVGIEFLDRLRAARGSGSVGRWGSSTSAKACMEIRRASCRERV
jgi:hypothetical protein